MSININIEFENNQNSRFAQQSSVPSIEDDLITERIRAKQQYANMANDLMAFEIRLTQVCEVSENRTFSKIAHQNKNTKKNIDMKTNHKDSSFTTAEDSLQNSIEYNSAENVNNLSFSFLEFHKTDSKSTSNKVAPKNVEKSGEVQQKLLLGLSALAKTFNKVQTKDVAFKLAHLKIFAQLTALKDKKVSKPKIASTKLSLPDKKKEFYRQWFNHRASQISGLNSDLNKSHTLA